MGLLLRKRRCDQNSVYKERDFRAGPSGFDMVARSEMRAGRNKARVEHRAAVKVRGWILCTLALLPGLRAAPQAGVARDNDTSLPELLGRVKANRERNLMLAQQYTSVEFWHNVNFDKKGKKRDDESAKFENVFVEGLRYRKKVEENGKPLTGKAAEEEQERYDKAVKERRAMPIEEKRRLFHSRGTFSWPLCCLTTLFDNRPVRHETIEGRDALVVESVPKPNARPANEAERSSLNWKETTWIDTADAMPARIDLESVQDEGLFFKGSTIRIDFTRLIESPTPGGQPEHAVWLQKSTVARFQIKVRGMRGSGETDETWSEFKRFHVDMRLLDDSVREVPQGTSPE